ncbi:MAG: hypothetical protein IKH50_04180 [Oscillospiraceae bacterium]|nr:hypothetical protein [Oscillospiraceae bacterium]
MTAPKKTKGALVLKITVFSGFSTEFFEIIIITEIIPVHKAILFIVLILLCIELTCPIGTNISSKSCQSGIAIIRNNGKNRSA